jgi:hypothetical protein
VTRTVELKSDAEEIRQFLKDLPAASNLGPKRWIWPRHVYRFDDIVTVAEILRSGTLLSRGECKRRGIRHRDQANTQIIENTKHLHRFVRLFFRPRTPTQYRMEGIHPQSEVEKNSGAHCPVSVFLVFSSIEVLTRKDAIFTDGSPTRKQEYSSGKNVDFLRTIPFRKVYHDGGMGGDAREITFRRHAEILIPAALDLDGVLHIVCREDPERRTLLHLLGKDAARWSDRIRTEWPGEDLFIRRGVFIKEISLVRDCIEVRNAKYRGKFEVSCRVWDNVTQEVIKDRTITNHEFGSGIKIRLTKAPASARVEFRVDGAIAFNGVLHQLPASEIVR